MVGRGRQAHVAAADRLVVHEHVGGDHARHSVLLVAPAEAAGKVHEAAALGIGGHAGLNGPADILAHGSVGLQLAHEALGEAAAEEEGIDLGQARIGNRAEEHQFGAGLLEGVEVVGVVEAEGRIARDAQAQRRLRLGCACRGSTRPQHFVGRRRLQQAVDVHLIRDGIGNRGDARPGRRRFVGRHQAEVALDDAELRIVEHGAEHRHVGVVLDDGAQLGFVARAAEAVEDDAGDADVAIEGLVAEDQRGDAARHAARIQHQHDGQVEQPGQRRIAVAAGEVEPVVEALVALDEGNVRVRAVTGEGVDQLVMRLHVEVQVAAGAAAGQAQPDRVDVVGALLEGLHGEAASAQGGGQAEAEGRLAGGLVRGGDEEAVHPLECNAAGGRPVSLRPPSAPRNRPAAGSAARVPQRR